MTDGQRKAFETLWARFGVERPEGLLDLPAVFGRDAPTVLEIGFGNGDSLAEMAAADPGRNYLGIEVHRPGVGHLLRILDEQGIGNVRVMSHDAVEILEQHIADASLAALHLYFPDPWHKKRHHKRRILQPEFVALVARKLQHDGRVHLATDWEDYAQQMLETLSAAPEFTNTAGPGRYAPRPEYRPLTKFEQRGKRLGHGVWDLLFRRN